METLIKTLFDAANAARANAHTPYYRYPVGAAICTASGQVFAACNTECSDGNSVCAEVAAIVAMVASGEQAIEAVLIVLESDEIVGPCGGCRQMIREFASLETPIHVCSPKGLRKTFTLSELLPYSFGPEHV